MSDINVSVADSDSFITVIVSDESDPIIVTVSEQLNAVADWQDVLNKPDFGVSAGEFAEGNDSRFVTNGNSHDHVGGDGAAISLTAAVTGILPIAKGGTGSSGGIANSVWTNDYSGSLTHLAPSAYGVQVLSGDGAGTPVFKDVKTIAVDLTTDQTIAGNKTLTGTTTIPLGAAAAPSLTFAGGTDTGVFSAGAGSVAVSTNGTKRVEVIGTGETGIGAAPTVGQGALQVVGNSKFSGYISVQNIAGYSNAGAYAIWGGSTVLNGGYLQLYGASHATSPGMLILGTPAVGYEVVLNGTGEVGIGSMPVAGAEKLQVTGNTKLTGDLKVTGAISLGGASLQPNTSLCAESGVGASSATYTAFQLKNTAAPLDKKYVRSYVNTTGNFGIERVNDAYSATTAVLQLDTADNLSLYAGGYRSVVLSNIGTSLNYFQLNASNGGAPITFVAGANSDIAIGVSSKGTGNHYFYTNNGNQAQFQISHNANAVNRMYTFGGATGLGAAFCTTGTDANVVQYFSSRGTSPIVFLTQQAYEQFRINNITSAVNSLSVQGAAAGGATAQSNAGNNTDISHVYATKGAGGHSFNTGGGLQFSITNTPSAVNALYVYGNAAGNPPCLCAGGSDANIDIPLIPKGTGRVRGTMLSFACERSALPTVGQLFAFGNGVATGLGAVMPFAGKLVAVGISGLAVTGTLVADAYVNEVANTGYQISVTGTGANAKAHTVFTTPLAFAAGSSLNWQVSTAPTAGTSWVLTFFVVFD